MSGLVSLFWNTRERRLRAFWRLLALAVLFVVGTLLLGIAFGALVVLATGRIAAAVPAFALAGAIASLLAAVLATWLAARFLDRRPFADLGWHLNGDWWADFGFGLALGALLMIGIFLVEWAAGWVTITGTLQSSAAGQPFALAILGPLVLFLCVGIYEELLARGYLLHNLAEGFNVRALGERGAIVLAWLLSSALFGLAHAGNPNATLVSTLNLIVAGLFLGLGYVVTGELAIPIGLHITWNFFQGNVFGFPVSGGRFFGATFIATGQGGPDLWTGGAFGPEAGLLGLLALLVGSLLILAWLRARYGAIRLHLPLAQPPAQRLPAIAAGAGPAT